MLIIERFGQPGKHDELPYRTVCKVKNNKNDIYEIYFQVSKDDIPHWEYMGLCSSSTPPEFIEQMLHENADLE